ncbi:hypothetical protein OAS86_05755, partial [Gammaproteobacteria bacterium]|nr:hypothetical protein [Gammaproteobacteria bacterium]
MSEFRQSISEDRTLWWLALAAVAALYGLVAATSPGFDDEIYTIAAIESHGWEAVLGAQTGDVHPPGQYAIAFGLHDLLGDWPRVRSVLAGALVACLIGSAVRVRRRFGRRAGWVFIALIGLSPGMMMWGTSLRWFSGFLPILLWLSLPPDRVSTRHWSLAAVGWWALAMINYVALLQVLSLIWIRWCADSRSSTLKRRDLLMAIALFVCLWAPQAWILATVHLENASSQTGGLTPSAIGFVIGFLSNSGVFPLSLSGVMAITGTLALLMAMVGRSPLRSIRDNPYALALALGLLALLLTGLAAKARNWIVLVPWFALWAASANSRWPRLFAAAMMLIVVAQMVGTVNVVTHRHTVKNSWNLPLTELTTVVE